MLEYVCVFYIIVEITVPISSTNISTSNECPCQDNLWLIHVKGEGKLEKKILFWKHFAAVFDS